MKYSSEKYKYYQFKNENDGTTVVAVSSYAGKPLRATQSATLEMNLMLKRVRSLRPPAVM